MAVQRKDEFIERMEKATEKAASDLEADLAKAEEDKLACQEENHRKEEEMRNKCEALNGAQRRREQAITDEIREIAEKLLKINEASTSILSQPIWRRWIWIWILSSSSHATIALRSTGSSGSWTL